MKVVKRAALAAVDISLPISARSSHRARVPARADICSRTPTSEKRMKTGNGEAHNEIQGVKTEKMTCQRKNGLCGHEWGTNLQENVHSQFCGGGARYDAHHLRTMPSSQDELFANDGDHVVQ
jgi:hypothetical protein